MTESAQTPKRRVGLTIWMIVSQLLAVASLFVWLMASFFGIMAFGALEAGETPTAIIALWAYPLLPLALAVAAWVAFARRKNTWAAILSGLTFAPVALLLLAMWIQTTLWNLQR